jgi:transcriptional regulator GlxA family with amidase domain
VGVPATLMTALAAPLAGTPDADGLVDPSRLPPLVRTAVDTIEQNLREPFTVEDLADACGVSARALQYAFRKHIGMTPMAYARQVRLAQAHRELETADPAGGVTVARVAAAWGFMNPGRFASYYAQQYGRRPSETLYDIRRR